MMTRDDDRAEPPDTAPGWGRGLIYNARLTEDRRPPLRGKTQIKGARGL